MAAGKKHFFAAYKPERKKNSKYFFQNEIASHAPTIDMTPKQTWLNFPFVHRPPSSPAGSLQKQPPSLPPPEAAEEEARKEERERVTSSSPGSWKEKEDSTYVGEVFGRIKRSQRHFLLISSPF